MLSQSFSAYEVPIPAFTMELLGKTLEQPTAEQHIDNNSVLLAFKNAAAAVQYLHSVNIAHRDIKPHFSCHVHSNSWEIKLIDFDAAEELKDNAETSPATPAYAPTSTDISQMFNAWKTWKMADLDIFALGKTFQEIVCDRGSALTDPFRHEFWTVQERLLHPNQNLQQSLIRAGRCPSCSCRMPSFNSALK
eukprot:symbB.v1.2.016679.t1/scaffold1275.1/size127301/7